MLSIPTTLIYLYILLPTYTFTLFRTRNEAKELIDATNTRTNHTQNEVTERLGGRVQDISYWKFELERTINDLTSNNASSKVHIF